MKKLGYLVLAIGLFLAGRYTASFGIELGLRESKTLLALKDQR